MLEELIEKYLSSKQLAENMEKTTRGFSIELSLVNRHLEDAKDELLAFIEKHCDTLIAWERRNALQTSPFDEQD